MLEAQNINKEYVKKGWFRTQSVLKAVQNVSLQIRQGETVGLVGESGCGKSTLGKCLALLEPLSGGHIYYRGQDITHLSFRQSRELRKDIQLILQDPVDSLNPRRTIEEIIIEPLMHFGIGSKQERKVKAEQIIKAVGLLPEHLTRYPAELSRGQCQRVNIARALILEPKILICDEIISALDVSVGVQILQLLKKLQEDRGYGYLFISHDLSRVTQISNRIAVMYMGKIVELAPGPSFHLEAIHPYSHSLLKAVPSLHREEHQEGNDLLGSDELPDPANPPKGCHFHPRCPYATDLCREQEPELKPYKEGHFAACHHMESLNK